MWTTLLSLVLRNWKYIAVGLISSIICVKIVSAYYQVKLEREVTAAVLKEQEKCAAMQRVTEEANNELSKKYSDIQRKLIASKRMSTAKCVLPANAPNSPTNRPEYAGQNGLSTDWLREYAAECEQYRSERTTLETFIMDTWKLNGK